MPYNDHYYIASMYFFAFTKYLIKQGYISAEDLEEVIIDFTSNLDNNLEELGVYDYEPT